MNHLYFENLRAVASNPAGGNVELQELAADYCDANDLPGPIETPYIKVDETTARQMAEWYENTRDQSDNAEVRRYYGEFIRQVRAQLRFLITKYGLKLDPFNDDFTPYKDSAEMMVDVRDNHHMYVYDGGADHPLMTRKETYEFRAVHDALGHAVCACQFGPRGELGAWMEHCKLFTPDARRALTAESQAHSNWVNYGPYSNLPVRERPFAEQKAVLVPEKWCTNDALQRAYAEYPDFFPPVTESNPRRRR